MRVRTQTKFLLAGLLGFTLGTSPQAEAGVRNWALLFGTVPLIALTFGTLTTSAFQEAPEGKTDADDSARLRENFLAQEILKNQIFQSDSMTFAGVERLTHPDVRLQTTQ